MRKKPIDSHWEPVTQPVYEDCEERAREIMSDVDRVSEELQDCQRLTERDLATRIEL